MSFIYLHKVSSSSAKRTHPSLSESAGYLVPFKTEFTPVYICKMRKCVVLFFPCVLYLNYFAIVYLRVINLVPTMKLKKLVLRMYNIFSRWVISSHYTVLLHGQKHKTKQQKTLDMLLEYEEDSDEWNNNVSIDKSRYH